MYFISFRGRTRESKKLEAIFCHKKNFLLYGAVQVSKKLVIFKILMMTFIFVFDMCFPDFPFLCFS